MARTRIDIDTSKAVREVRALSNELDKLDKNLSNTIKDSQKNLGGIDGTIGSITKSFSTFKSLAIPAVFLGIGAGATKAATDILKVADSLVASTARLKIVTGSQEEYKQSLDGLYEISKKTGTSLSSNIDVFSRFSLAVQGQNVSTQELLTLTQTLNQALVLSGASGAESTSVMRQLSQAFSSGVLRGDEFNSVVENGGRIVKMLTDYTGKSVGELRDMAEAGEITSKVLKGALVEGAGKVNEEFTKMPVTIDRAKMALEDVFVKIISDANEASGGTNQISQSIIELANTIEQNREGIISLFSSIIEMSASAVEMVANLGNAISFLSDPYDTLNKKSDSLSKSTQHLLSDLKDLTNQQKELNETIENWPEDEYGNILDENGLEKAQERLRQINIDIENTQKWLLDTQKAAQSTTKELNKMVDPLEAFYEASDDIGKKSTNIAKEVCKNEKKKRDCAKKSSDESRKLWLDSLDKQKDDLNKHIKYHEELYRNTDMFVGLVDANKRAADMIEEQNKESAKQSTDYWNSFTEDTKQGLHDWIESGIKLEFDSLKDAWKSLTDTLLNIFVDMLAKMIAEWIASGIAGLFSGDGFSGFKMPSFGGGSFGSGSLGQIGGAIGLVGGAYGMYRGAKDISNGNVAGGAVELGMGGYSAYQGAVTLGLVEEGTATAVYNGVVDGISTAFSGSTGATVVGSSLSYNTGEIAALDAYYGSSLTAGTATAGTATAGEGASMGMGTAASYAGAAAVVASVAYGIYKNFSKDKRNPEQRAYGNLLNDVRDGREWYDMAEDTEVGHGYLVDLTEDFKTRIKGAFEDIATSVAFDYRGMTERLKNNLSGVGVEQFIQEISGLTLSVEQSSIALQLAQEATDGSAVAMQNLEGYLLSLGLTSEQADATVVGLMEALAETGQVADTTMGSLIGLTDEQILYNESLLGGSESVDQMVDAIMTSDAELEDLVNSLTNYNATTKESREIIRLAESATQGNTNALEQLVAVFESLGMSSDEAKGSTMSMIRAIQQLDNTDLDLKATAELLVKVKGDANVTGSVGGGTNISSREFDYSGYDSGESNGAIHDYYGMATGGIAIKPQVYRRTIFGEAGAEAVLPLHNGRNTLKVMDNKLNTLISFLSSEIINQKDNGCNVIVMVDGEEISSKIIPHTDKFITDKFNRGMMEQRVVF